MNQTLSSELYTASFFSITVTLPIITCLLFTLDIMIVQALLMLAVVYLSWSFITMEINYRRASSMGIPLIRLPVDPMNIPWMTFESHLWQILDRLPFDWGTFGRYSRRGWYFKDKAESHLRYGKVFALVTPRDIYVHVADPEAVHDIFTRRADFIRPTKMYST